MHPSSSSPAGPSGSAPGPAQQSPLSAGVLGELDPWIEPIRSALAGRSTALAQEWIGSRAGSEKVFEALAVLLPEADLFALTRTPGVAIESGGRAITTSFLDRPALRDRRALTLPLMPLAWRRLRRDHDVVITSAHALARSFGRTSGLHLSYVHSPARYLWFPEVDTRSSSFANVVQAPVRAALKRLDLRDTADTDSLVANSATTARRTNDVYGRVAEVIPPPVDTVFYSPDPDVSRSGLLALGRLIPYKQMDTAIEIAHRVGMPLTIVGQGPEQERLEQLAESLGANVDFRGSASDDDVRSLYRTSAALLFPGNEDFGIVPVEAMACGCPVVAAGLGGALETVVDGVTGVHADTPTLEGLVAATERLLDLDLAAAACREQAAQYSYAIFGRRVSEWLTDAISTGSRGRS